MKEEKYEGVVNDILYPGSKNKISAKSLGPTWRYELFFYLPYSEALSQYIDTLAAVQDFLRARFNLPKGVGSLHLEGGGPGRTRGASVTFCSNILPYSHKLGMKKVNDNE